MTKQCLWLSALMACIPMPCGADDTYSATQGRDNTSFTQEYSAVMSDEPPPPAGMQLIIPKLEIRGLKPANRMRTAQLQLNSAVFTNSSLADPSQNSSSVTNTVFFNGASLNLMPQLGDSTWLSANVNGGFIRFDGAEVNDYDSINANVGIFQQLTKNMWGEIGWRYNQYYVQDNIVNPLDPRDLQEQGVRASLNRIDHVPWDFYWLNNYEIQANFSNPVDRTRISHYLSSGIIHALPYNFQAGMFYRLKHDDFTERSVFDHATRHEFEAQLIYSVNKYINLMGTVSYQFGDTIDLLRDPVAGQNPTTENNLGNLAFGFRINANVPLLD